MISLKPPKSKDISKLLALLLSTFFFKELLMAAVVPIWQAPDEQAHFAQVAYFAEFNSMPKAQPLDLNKEIEQSELLLGTKRDLQGNNKFTYHPQYRIDYTNSSIGKYETEIDNFPQSYRHQLVGQEAANYPPLYYMLVAIPYKLFYNSDLFTRVYLARFISVILSLGTIYLAWLIGELLFPENEVLVVTLASLVAFQPMFSFVSVGVNSDNLMNLLFSIIVYLSLIIIKMGFSKRIGLEVLATLVLLYLTKPQFILAVPVVIIALVWSLSISKKISSTTKLASFISGFLVIILLAVLSKIPVVYSFIEKVYPQSFSPQGSGHFNISLVSFAKETITRTIHETIPWYFGVFDWLGVTLPIGVLRVINRILILVGIGLLVKLWLIVKRRTLEDHLFLFLGLVVLFYFMAINYYNYLFLQTHNFSFGLQGRYFFPVIIPQVAMILIGILSLVPARFLQIKEYVSKILVVFMTALFFFAMWLIANTYYQLTSWSTFTNQVSQYKIQVFKGSSIYILLVIVVFLQIFYLINFFRLRVER